MLEVYLIVIKERVKSGKAEKVYAEVIHRPRTCLISHTTLYKRTHTGLQCYIATIEYTSNMAAFSIDVIVAVFIHSVTQTTSRVTG